MIEILNHYHLGRLTPLAPTVGDPDDDFIRAVDRGPLYVARSLEIFRHRTLSRIYKRCVMTPALLAADESLADLRSWISIFAPVSQRSAMTNVIQAADELVADLVGAELHRQARDVLRALRPDDCTIVRPDPDRIRVRLAWDHVAFAVVSEQRHALVSVAEGEAGDGEKARLWGAQRQSLIGEVIDFEAESASARHMAHLLDALRSSARLRAAIPSKARRDVHARVDRMVAHAERAIVALADPPAANIFAGRRLGWGRDWTDR